MSIWDNERSLPENEDDIKGEELEHLRLDTVLDSCAGIFKQSMGARNREGIGMSYRPARQHMLAESILSLFKSLNIRALTFGRGGGGGVSFPHVYL
jgi:hypothetical protein